MVSFEYLEGFGPVQQALLAGLFTWFMTAAGAGVVFFFSEINRKVLDGMLGFAAGVMIAASCFGLLGPAIEQTSGEGLEKVLPAAKPSIPSSTLRFISEKKKTTPAPAAVMNQVKSPANRACCTGPKPSRYSKLTI
jgi:ZIP family zinc transporter